MTRKQGYTWFGIFAVCNIAYTLIQDTIRPASIGYQPWLKYLLGIAPNFFAAIGLPAIFLLLIPFVYRQQLPPHRTRNISLLVGVLGLVLWELAQTFSKRGHFDPHDILWTIAGGGGFYLLFLLIHRPAEQQ